MDEHSQTADTRIQPQEQRQAVSREARATRLKRLRKMTGKSRKAFSNQHGVSQGTLQNWETARFGGLTEKGAQMMISALKKEGVVVRFEWLMYGAGQGPDLFESMQPSPIPEPQAHAPHDALERELAHFRAIHTHILHTQISDDAMEPYFQQGELLAGKRITEKLEQYTGQYCLVETADKKVSCRYVKPGTQPGLYHLFSINPHTALPQPVLYNVRIRALAPIMWIRRTKSD